MIYPDLLRAGASIGVVILSVSLALTGSAGLFSRLFYFCVPLFVMLSGMFFLHPNQYVPMQRLVKRYLLRLVAALIFWGLLYGVVDGLTAGYGAKSVLYAVESVLKGNLHNHLWFLPVMIGLYLAMPVLRVFTAHASRLQLEYFLLISFLFASVISMLTSLGGSPLLLSLFAPSVAAGYTGYFVLGYYLRQYDFQQMERRTLYLFLAGLLLTLLLSFQTAGGYFDPLTVGLAMLAFLFAKKIVTRVQLQPKLMKSAGLAAHFSFGVYLIHPFILMLLTFYGFDAAFLPPILGVPLISAIVYSISLACSYGLSKLPVLSPYIV